VSKSFRGLKAISEVAFRMAEKRSWGSSAQRRWKTTLFNLITGFLQPDEGRINFLGRISWPGASRHLQIGNHQNLPDRQTLQPSLHPGERAVGCYNRTAAVEEVEEKAWEILRFVGLENKALQPASSLTTPDRKRLEMARALGTRPSSCSSTRSMARPQPERAGDIVALVHRIREAGLRFLSSNITCE